MTEQQQKKKKFPINRPKTSFAMKANLVQREPQFQKTWDKANLYQQMCDSDHPNGPFVFHDGPPYANGDIHLGHLLNKVLKDMVVRSKIMAGYDVQYVPGWDCHGLPIEHKVMKNEAEKGDPTANLDEAAYKIDIRRKCKKYASKYVKLQAGQMKRLGTVAHYDNPYLTMTPAYEAAVLEVFATLVDKKLVYRALKPVHWSIANQTALAEAELEYYDREDTSIYVHFDVADNTLLPNTLAAPSNQTVSLMIWTTTPWTLPANLAVAASAKAVYSLYRYTDQHGKTRHTILAEALAEQVIAGAGCIDITKLGECTGSELAEAGVTYKHPFIDRQSPIVTAEYVTLEDGTGLVHTAPGHGVDDYQTGMAHGLDIYCPVLGDGTFDETVPNWLVGQDIWEANGLVIEQLKKSSHLHLAEEFTHSYPHDWRSKTPVIFRATDQWFISVSDEFDDGDSLQQRALDVTNHSLYKTQVKMLEDELDAQQNYSDHPEDFSDEPTKDSMLKIEEILKRAKSRRDNAVEFVPQWGKNRMRGMLESRPDWCISRQRAWGLPIPAFYGPKEGQILLTNASVQAVANCIREKGSDVWYLANARDILAEYNPDTDSEAPDWIKQALASDEIEITKSSDIFDVWFESGSSWNAVMKQRGLAHEQGPATDLYLEGSDQHRGWFQLSLLLGLGATGHPPFKTVLTHGFMVDKDGMKMSKSDGNALGVEELLKEQGADICRWWVSSINYANDIKVNREFFRLAGEEYRKVRNTIRFLLSNLGDFDANQDRRPLTDGDATSIDAWVMDQTAQLVNTVRSAFKEYNFRKANEAIYNFCNDTLSSVYLGAVKDRMYCDKIESDRRRRTQTVMFDIADALIRLLAPILVHTAEEARQALHGQEINSVHLQMFPDTGDFKVTASEHWPEVIALRDRVLKELEDARNRRGIDNPLDCGVEVACQSSDYVIYKPFVSELADMCGVSRFSLDENGDETIGIEDLTHEPRCMRSWKRDGTVGEYTDSDGDMVTLSKRDAEALGLV